MDDRRRMYHQASQLTIGSVDMRHYPMDPEFKGLVQQARDFREAAWMYGWDWARSQGTQMHDGGRMAWVEHRLMVHAGLDKQQEHRPPEQNYERPLTDDLVEFLTHIREVRGF